MADLTEQPWREWGREALWRKLQEAEGRLQVVSAERDKLAEQFDRIAEIGEQGASAGETWKGRAEAAEAELERLRVLRHELSLIEADTRRGITDCSTPLFQRVRNIVAQAEAAERVRDERNAWLAECYRLSGADTDGNEDWRLAPTAVDAVRQLREDYDEAGKQAEAAEARVAELEGAAIADQMALDEKRELLANLHGLTADADLWADLIRQRDEARARVAELENEAREQSAAAPTHVGEAEVKAGLRAWLQAPVWQPIDLAKLPRWRMESWSNWETDEEGIDQQPDPNGPWVAFDDVEKLLAATLPPAPSVAEAPAGAESAGGEA